MSIVIRDVDETWDEVYYKPFKDIEPHTIGTTKSSIIVNELIDSIDSLSDTQKAEVLLLIFGVLSNLDNHSMHRNLFKFHKANKFTFEPIVFDEMTKLVNNSNYFPFEITGCINDLKERNEVHVIIDFKENWVSPWREQNER